MFPVKREKPIVLATITTTWSQIQRSSSSRRGEWEEGQIYRVDLHSDLHLHSDLQINVHVKVHLLGWHKIEITKQWKPLYSVTQAKKTQNT